MEEYQSLYLTIYMYKTIKFPILPQWLQGTIRQQYWMVKVGMDDSERGRRDSTLKPYGYCF
jgi:hypothetical protein